MKYQVQVTREAMVAFDVEIEAEDEKEAKELAEQEALECSPDDWHMLEHGWRMKDFYETHAELS
jgi:sulfur relay (sulfurtransferase) DsrC/TusE family protein